MFAYCKNFHPLDTNFTLSFQIVYGLHFLHKSEAEVFAAVLRSSLEVLAGGPPRLPWQRIENVADEVKENMLGHHVQQSGEQQGQRGQGWPKVGASRVSV